MEGDLRWGVFVRLLLGEWLGSGVTCAIWCVVGALRLLGRACIPAGLLWLWCCPVVGCRFRGPWVALGFPFGGGLRVTLLAWCSAPAGVACGSPGFTCPHA